MSAEPLVLNRWSTRFLVAMALLAVGLIVGIVVITHLPAVTQSAVVVTGNEASIRRGVDASAARYTAMAADLATKKDAVQRGIDASAARYTALAAYYAAKNDPVQRGIDASAARYTAMAADLAAKSDAIQRGIDASTARYTALAEYYGGAAASK
jgi:hypothetical protein